MIYLIDDTPIQMLEGYMKPSEFNDVLRRMDSIPLEDVPSISGAACVLIHSSYSNPLVKRRLIDVFDAGAVAPVVLFSDGDNEEAQFNGENYIISIKKSVLYSRLPGFLKSYRKNGQVNLKILSGEEGSAPIKKKFESLSGNVFADYFSKVTIDFAPEKEDSNGPCAYCIGRDGMDSIARKIGGEFLKANASFLQGNDARSQDGKIHDFLVSSVKKEVTAFLLDADTDPGLFMQLALHIRLTDALPGGSRFAPIVFISDNPLERLIKKSSFGQIFLTHGTYICRRSDYERVLESSRSLDENTFRSDFLDRINIPAPKGSNHSLANQWGASRLYMLISGADAKKDAFKDFQDIHKRLYFKYISHKIPTASDPKAIRGLSYKVKNATGKRVLLIDDEAEKGWTKALSLIMPFANLSVISETVLDYGDFSEKARRTIEELDYDLVLLDLRLGGVREDYVVDPEQMSGYKVLRKIKELNRGVQVIMLTASNKAWNLKALMAPGKGADGYFVKESPEYEFSDDLSAANLRSLIGDMERCLEQGYLRYLWTFSHSFDSGTSELAGEIATQLGIAYEMASKALNPEDFSYAFLSLYQTVEIVTSRLTDWKEDTTDKNMKLLYLKRRDGGDYSKELVSPSGEEVLWRLKPLALRKVSRNALFPQKERLGAIYLQLWEKEDRGLLFVMEQLIEIRNALIHPENARLFKTVAPISEGTFHQNHYFRDETFVFGTPAFKPLFREAASKGLLYVDAGKRPVLHKDITSSQLGLRILLTCLREILPLINNEQ